MEIIFQHPENYAQIRFEAPKKLFVLSLKGKIPYDAYKAIFERALELFIQTQSEYFIIDIHQIISSDPMARAWLVTQFMPKVVRKISVKTKVAIVKPQNVFQRFAVLALIPSLERIFGIKTNVSETYEEAYKWINE